jgi:hypothetical protein
MSREFMCQYGNCSNESSEHPYLVTHTTVWGGGKKEREQWRFCCTEHAALYLTERAKREVQP